MSLLYSIFHLYESKIFVIEGTGWSGPPSLMSSSGGPPSGVSSSGPSSPNCFSEFYSRGSSDMSASQVSTDGYVIYANSLYSDNFHLKYFFFINSYGIGMSAITQIFPDLDQELNNVNVELEASDIYSFGCQSHGLQLSTRG